MSFKKNAGEDVLLNSQVKLNGQIGNLVLTSVRVAWCKANTSQPAVSLPFSDIKNQFVSTASSTKALLKLITDETPGAPNLVLEFTHPSSAREDLHMFREALAQVLPKKKQTPSAATTTTPDNKAPTAPKPTAPNANVSTASSLNKIANSEIEQRASLLAGNKELLFLHERLVNTGIISESEFWESRKAMLTNEATRAEKQATGIPSMLLADVRPTLETSNSVHYKLTPQIIQQVSFRICYKSCLISGKIFLQFPAVQRAYAENVPTKMTEHQFWQAYLQSQWFQRDRQKGGLATGGSDLFARYIAEDERDEKEPVVIKRKLKDLDPLSDISADSDATLPEGYGLAMDDGNQPKKLMKVIPLIRKFNRHGALVIGSPSLNVAKDSKSTVMHLFFLFFFGFAKLYLTFIIYHNKVQTQVNMPDLEAPAPPDVVPLKIQDPRRYFDGHTSANLGDSESTTKVLAVELRKSFHSDISSWSPDLSHAVVDGETARPITVELQNFASVQLQSSGDPIQELGLPDNFMKELYEALDTGNELLRHFWGSVPKSTTLISKHSKQLEKLEKLCTNVSNLYDHLEHIKQTLPDNKKIGNWRRLFSHTAESLNKAIEKTHQIEKEIQNK